MLGFVACNATFPTKFRTTFSHVFVFYVLELFNFTLCTYRIENVARRIAIIFHFNLYYGQCREANGTCLANLRLVDISRLDAGRRLLKFQRLDG